MRPTIDSYFLKMAVLVSARATCKRRAVGCVLVDGRNHVLATGYNGVASGQPHCNKEHLEYVIMDRAPQWLVEGLRKLGSEGHAGVYSDEYLGRMGVSVDRTWPHACEGAESPSGEDLDKCQAIHAEQNALLQCRDVSEVRTAYLTVSPCVACTKLFMATGVRRIVYLDKYVQRGVEELAGSKGIELVQLLRA